MKKQIGEILKEFVSIYRYDNAATSQLRMKLLNNLTIIGVRSTFARKKLKYSIPHGSQQRSLSIRNCEVKCRALSGL